VVVALHPSFVPGYPPVVQWLPAESRQEGPETEWATCAERRLPTTAGPQTHQDLYGGTWLHPRRRLKARLMSQQLADKSWICQESGRLLVIQIPESYSDDDFAREFDQLSRLLREGKEALGLLVEVKMKSRSTPQNRERAKQFFREEKSMLKNRVRASALVSENGAIRAAISTASFLGLFPFLTKTFTQAAEARRWLEIQMASGTSGNADRY
jgi:hypothetical protein